MTCSTSKNISAQSNCTIISRDIMECNYTLKCGGNVICDSIINLGKIAKEAAGQLARIQGL